MSENMKNDHLSNENSQEICSWAESYALGSATPEERVAFEQHAKACVHCSARLEAAVDTIVDITAMAPMSAGSRDQFVSKLRAGKGAISPATQPVTMKKVLLGIHGKDVAVDECAHIAFFWETERQFKDAVGFLEVGFHEQDHGVVFGYEDANEKVLSILQERGLNVEQLIAKGRLSVLEAESTGDATLQKIGDIFKKALEGGAPLIRLLGNIGWHRPKWPDETDILAFEAKVTAAARAFPCVIVCMYDVNALSGKVIMRGGLETHPVTIRGDAVRKNPFYVPVDGFLGKLRDEARG